MGSNMDVLGEISDTVYYIIYPLGRIDVAKAGLLLVGTLRQFVLAVTYPHLVLPSGGIRGHRCVERRIISFATKTLL
jgi:hypothetical protein